VCECPEALSQPAATVASAPAPGDADAFAVIGTVQTACAAGGLPPGVDYVIEPLPSLELTARGPGGG